MSPSPLVWTMSGCALLSSIAGSGIILSRQRAEAESVKSRLASIVEAFALSDERSARTYTRRDQSRLSTRVRVERLFGFDRRRRAHLGVAFSRVLGVSVAATALVAFLACRMAGIAGVLLAPALLGALPRMFYRRCDRRYSAKLFKQFPDALGMIVRAVRVGVGISNAVTLVAEESQAPTALEFRQLAEEIAIGQPLQDALRAMASRNQLAEYRFFATALSLQSQTGGGLAETLETLADTIRKRVAIQLRGHALAAEARISCYVLGALPFASGGALFASNPSYIGLLFTTAAGEKLLGVAVVMLVLGLSVMQMMTKRALE